MFHRYVMTSSGRHVDFDRAAWLMDRGLLDEAAEWVEKNWKDIEADYNLGNKIMFGKAARERSFTDSHRLELLWGRYCDLHYEKYDEPFEPDQSLSWDA